MKLTQRFKINPLTASVALVVAAGLSGCGGSDSSSNTSANGGQQVQLSGLVAKGIIKDALVSVYGDQDGDGKYDPIPITQTSTDANGDYKVNLPQGYTGPVNIQITRGISGKMVCDITAGCKSGTTSIAFGKEMDLPQGFLLEAVDSVSNDSNTEKPVSVTSLTHMAAKYAKSRGADATAVKEANEKVAKMVGISNLTGTRPINITDSTALKSADSNARKLSVLSAALAKDAMTSDNGDITAALDDWANEFTANGGGLVANVTSLDNPETAFSLEKLLTEANAESSAITNTMIALEKEERGYDSLTPEEQAIIDAEMQSLQTELDAAIASETSSFSTALTEANEQTIGEVEEIVTEGTTVLSSAEEVKAFVDDVRTWATLLSEEQQIALANEDMVFSEEANLVMNGLDAGGLLMAYYSQYMNLFDGFTFGDKVDGAMFGLGEDFNNFSMTIAALDTALVNAVEATAVGEAGTASATLSNGQTAALSFSKDSTGKVTLTGLPQTISDGAGNTLEIRSGSLLVNEDATGLTKLAVNFDVSFKGAKGSSLTGKLDVLGEPLENAFFGVKQDSKVSFTGQLGLKDAGTATLTAAITPKGVTLSNLDYNYSGTDGSFSFSGAGTQLEIASFWETLSTYTYYSSPDGGSSWEPTGSSTDAYDSMELRGTLKGTLKMSHAGNNLNMSVDTGMYLDEKSLEYGDLGLVALRDAVIAVTNAAGNTLSLTSTYDPVKGTIAFAHNAVNYTDPTTGNSFSLTSAKATTVSEDLGYLMQGLASGWDGDRVPFKAEVNGLKLTSKAPNLQNIENTYQFSGNMSATMMLHAVKEITPYEYCDPYGCYPSYYHRVVLEPVPAGISVSGQFSNLTVGSYMKAGASFTAPNALSALNTNSLWWHIQEEGLEMGNVIIADDGKSFTSTLWDSSLSTNFTDFAGNNLSPQPVVVKGSLIPGAIQFTSEPVTNSWGDGFYYKTDVSSVTTTMLPCSDDSSLEACAASVTVADGLNYNLSDERSMGTLFAFGHSRLNAYNSSTPSDERIRYQVRRAIKQENGTFKLTGQKRLRKTPNNMKFYSNMAASITFEPKLPSLPETASITLNGNIGNLSGEGDLLMEQTDATGNVVAQASKGLVSAILKYGNREIWLSTQLKANQETYPVEYMDWNGNLVTENYTEDYLEPVSGFIKITNASGTSMKIVPKADDLGIVTGELRAADGGLWGTIYEAASGQLMVAYRNGAVETLTLASTGDLAQPEEISTSETDPKFCELNPDYEGCSSTTTETETAPETVTEATDTTTEVTTTASL